MTVTQPPPAEYVAMTEAQLQARLRRGCRERRLVYYHTHDSRRSDPGFLDTFIVGPAAPAAVEVKTWDRRNRVSETQRMWLAVLEFVGIKAVVFDASHFAPTSIAGPSTVDRFLDQLAGGPRRWPSQIEYAVARFWNPDSLPPPRARTGRRRAA